MNRNKLLDITAPISDIRAVPISSIRRNFMEFQFRRRVTDRFLAPPDSFHDLSRHRTVLRLVFKKKKMKKLSVEILWNREVNAFLTTKVRTFSSACPMKNWRYFELCKKGNRTTVYSSSFQSMKLLVWQSWIRFSQRDVVVKITKKFCRNSRDVWIQKYSIKVTIE